MDFSQFKNVVWKEGEHYVAQSLNVDVSSFGATKTEALVHLREALELYFEDSDIAESLAISEVEFAAV
jgi:predicted RNase H-like HicB family nuclease